MQYCVERSDPTAAGGGDETLTVDARITNIDAPTAVAAVLEFIRRKRLHLLGPIEEGGDSASATCTNSDGRKVVVRAWPH
ncbi:MAG TPA: hypothetical protein VF980_17340 [Thermoanaerobaculia bacterium]